MSADINIRSCWRGHCPLLGPALYVWVQGCPLRCPGCFNTEGLDMDRCATLTAPNVLAERFLEDPTALVLSGGEPFAQASALAGALRIIRAQAQQAPVLAYSGYPLEHLLSGAIAGALDLLGLLDVLVDGPFQRQHPSDHPLLGSENQRVFLLGSRVPVARLEALKRPQIEAEVDINGGLRLVGTGGNGFDMHALPALLLRHGIILE
ncbi:4Fe-4S cluster-binding domain-containing protein [uncultured Thiodictyon sp.]|jgi:anaerobic ribonucleoside-triphosphate reductase activating protein|uniref:4Fe-4S cluster-binding domain-containing protein n=1 Tax=uncultured Thiodictyon sp. TaxID=1846217 RepID=UPI0025F17038|nr:4Fe-4S cluster-binding domain-containing protein [uncultured Thiodictyon sp.]